jgi:hypothetical protein
MAIHDLRDTIPAKQYLCRRTARTLVPQMLPLMEAAEDVYPQRGALGLPVPRAPAL